MIPYIEYSLTVIVHGKHGIIVADYFETRNYHKALETFDDMLTEARINNFGFGSTCTCDVILTKNMHDSDGKWLKSDQLKVHVHGEEADL